MTIYPSFDQFSRWLKKYEVIPFCLKIPDKGVVKDPFRYFVDGAGDKPGTFFLDSYDALPNGRYSYFPLSSPVREFASESCKGSMKLWKEMERFSQMNLGPNIPSDFPPFYGGLAGIISYDCGRIFEKGWQTSSPPDPLKFLAIHFGVYNDLFCYDQKEKSIYIFTCLSAKKMRKRNRRELYESQREVLLKHARDLEKGFASTEFDPRQNPSVAREQFIERVSGKNRERFLRSVKKIKEYVAAGDIYQANLSQRIEFESSLSSFDFFGRLRKINPSPYACFFRLPGYDLVSCSPELLLKRRGDILETRPIAGTRPRGKSAAADRIMRGDLLLSEKERAEHIMLVDLERNDLGRVCVPGSVKVTEKMSVEKYSHVMHIVSHVTGKMKERGTIYGALASLLPGGTITGCPKVRCMQILDEIEPVARGPFFGSAGWVGYQGDAEFNLLIRTALMQRSGKKRKSLSGKRKIYVQVGSGIVADSDPQMEYEESLHKAQALLEALK